MSLLDDYLTPQTLAAELGLHVRTLRKLAERGEGPPRTQIGRKVLYRRESVISWLTSREQHLPRRRSNRD